MCVRGGGERVSADRAPTTDEQTNRSTSDQRCRRDVLNVWHSPSLVRLCIASFRTAIAFPSRDHCTRKRSSVLSQTAAIALTEVPPRTTCHHRCRTPDRSAMRSPNGPYRGVPLPCFHRSSRQTLGDRNNSVVHGHRIVFISLRSILVFLLIRSRNIVRSVTFRISLRPSLRASILLSVAPNYIVSWRGK